MRSPAGWPVSISRSAGTPSSRASAAFLSSVPHTISGRQGSLIEWMSSSRSAASTKGCSCARAAQLDRVARAEQLLVGPDAVQVLVDAARRVGVGGVEARVGLDVGEGQRQAAAPRPEALPQQPVERDRAADLVAVRQRLHHHVRARARRLRDGARSRRRCCRRARGRCRAASVRRAGRRSSAAFSAQALPPRAAVRNAPRIRVDQAIRWPCSTSKPACLLQRRSASMYRRLLTSSCRLWRPAAGSA